MAEIAGGTQYLQAGTNPKTRVDLGSMPLSQLNQARGATGTFINGRGKPDNSGVLWAMPYRPLAGAPRGGAHRGPGERLYVALDPSVDDQIFPANSTIELHEEIVNVKTGATRTEIWAIGDKSTDVPTGGINGNPNLIRGQKVPYIALPALGPDEYGRVFEFCRVVTADA